MGSPTKALLLFALPIFLGQLFQQLYNVTDIKVVGIELGDDAINAMSAVGPVYSILIGIANGLNNGCGIIAARAFGAKDFGMLRRTITHMLVINFSTTVFFAAVGLLLIDPLIALMKVPEATTGDAKVYLTFILCGMVTTIAYNMCASILRAVGDSKTPLYFLIGCSLLNVCLDLLFVLVLKLGIGGAAAATIIAQAVSALLCLFYIKHFRKELHVSREDFVFDRNLLKELLAMGFSMGLITSLVSFGSAAVTTANNALTDAGWSEDVIGAAGSARRIDGLFMMPLSTLGTALATFVSQNKGAGRIDRIRKAIKSALGLGVLWSALGALVIYTFGDSLIRLITDTESAEMIKYGVLFMRINCPFFLMLITLLIFRSVLQGFSKKLIPITTAIAELVLKFFAALVLVPHFGFLGICVAEPIVWTLTAIIVSFVYIRNIKKFMTLQA